jgi:crossover junction endodeoxyribonuclease RuvC
MSSNTPIRILALDPGTRHLGIAVLENGSLLYHGVHSFRRQDSPHGMLTLGRALVARLIRDFRPQVLAVEKTFFANNRNTALLNVFAEEIKAVGRRLGLQVVAFAPSTVKKAIAGNGQATKRDVAHAVVGRFPELKVYLTQDQQWKERYHSNMFDAVALGLVAARRNL